MTLRSSFLALGVFAFAACADPVAPRQARPSVPDGPNPAVVVNSIDPVEFTLPAGPLCGLTSEVTGTGEFHTVIRVSQSNGVTKVVMNLSAHGTASGADGSQYVFNYANLQEVTEDVIDIVDHFNLIGQGGTPDLKVYLRGTFQATFPFDPIGDPVIRGPSILCDPI
jgi:hypothetical protein